MKEHPRHQKRLWCKYIAIGLFIGFIACAGPASDKEAIRKVFKTYLNNLNDSISVELNTPLLSQQYIDNFLRRAQLALLADSMQLRRMSFSDQSSILQMRHSVPKEVLKAGDFIEIQKALTYGNINVLTEDIELEMLMFEGRDKAIAGYKSFFSANSVVFHREGGEWKIDLDGDPAIQQMKFDKLMRNYREQGYTEDYLLKMSILGSPDSSLHWNPAE